MGEGAPKKELPSRPKSKDLEVQRSGEVPPGVLEELRDTKRPLAACEVYKEWMRESLRLIQDEETDVQRIIRQTIRQMLLEAAVLADAGRFDSAVIKLTGLLQDVEIPDTDTQVEIMGKIAEYSQKQGDQPEPEI